MNFSEQEIRGAWELIQASKKVALLTHLKPDGDGVGACVALEHLLLSLDKSVEVIYPNKPDLEYPHNPKNLLVGKHSQLPDLIIASDVASADRMYYPDVFKEIPLINIDHHVSNTIQGVHNFVGAESASMCEVLYELFLEWDVTIDKNIANALLMGVLYDTRMFSTKMTTAGSLRIAADLVDKGGDLFGLRVALFAVNTPEIIKLWEFLLNRIQISKSGLACWSYIMQKDMKKLGVTTASLVGFSNFLSDISGIDVSILFYETKSGDTKVSMRSKDYDVNALAQKFGGGGHKNASGALSRKPLQEVMDEMTKEL